MRTAIFVGSFDPFHEGHKNRVERALQLFDNVIVGVGVNPQKQYKFSLEERLEQIKATLSEYDITVEAYSDLTIDFARRHKAQYIVKGVRNATDYLYEKETAAWNKAHGGVETILLLAEPKLEEVSSTRLRNEL
mgnify:FL=1